MLDLSSSHLFRPRLCAFVTIVSLAGPKRASDDRKSNAVRFVNGTTRPNNVCICLPTLSNRVACLSDVSSSRSAVRSSSATFFASFAVRRLNFLQKRKNVLRREKTFVLTNFFSHRFDFQFQTRLNFRGNFQLFHCTLIVGRGFRCSVVARRKVKQISCERPTRDGTNRNEDFLYLSAPERRFPVRLTFRLRFLRRRSATLCP